jgi:hypothetical protein
MFSLVMFSENITICFASYERAHNSVVRHDKMLKLFAHVSCYHSCQPLAIYSMHKMTCCHANISEYVSKHGSISLQGYEDLFFLLQLRSLKIAKVQFKCP